MKRLILILFLLVLLLSLGKRAGEGDFSKMNSVLVARLSENPRVAEVFGIVCEEAVET